MRAAHFALLLTLAAPVAPAGAVEPLLPAHVDERVELFSILFRLAGRPEYDHNELPPYDADIKAAFAPFAHHPAVERAKALVESRGIGYDAVMWLAVNVSPPPSLAPLAPFSGTLPEERWRANEAMSFAKLAARFYRDTRFADFFAAHGALYAEAETRFSAVTSQLDVGWFARFYGVAPPKNIHIIIGLNNGHSNYGMHVALPDGSEELTPIVGCWTKDAASQPTFSDGGAYLPILIHELNHSFVNRIVHAHWPLFAGAADRTFAKVADQMRDHAYGNARIMVDESLVRAAVIAYFDARGQTSVVARKIIDEQTNGFVWMDELVALLRRYRDERARFATLEAYLPEVARLYGDVAAHIDDKIAAFEQRCVHVIAVEPVAAGARDVDPATKTLTVRFDRALDPRRGYSVDYGALGKAHFPVVGTPELLPGNQAIRLQLALAPHTRYQLVIAGTAFTGADGYPVVDHLVEFTTR